MESGGALVPSFNTHQRVSFNDLSRSTVTAKSKVAVTIERRIFMDLEVVGRHALLFDDDSMAAFVNSSDALVDWNSLLIDRYDVRHLLSNPPPPRKRRRHQNSLSPPLASSGDPLQSELDHERYLDLPSPSDEQDNGVERMDDGSYHAVAFSYGYPDESANQKKADAELECSGFHPPFLVPESLLQSLPPTEKIHQIIARTALFVSKHGGQSEIVLRVKQGNNPMFGFLMPDNHLHSYFRFLVDHQELLKSDFDSKYQQEEKNADTEDNQAGGVGGSGALSLLGSVYGSGEDEDVATEDAPKSRENDSGGTFDALNAAISHGLEQKEFSVNGAGKDEPLPLPKHPVPSSKEKAASKRIRSISMNKAGTTSVLKKESGTSGPFYADTEKSQASALSSTLKVETLILEPPSDLKRLVDKIVEFILKNGKEFEAVLVEQDSKHGRFPFLLPTNQYHPYYLKILQKAQESKIAGKSFISEKDDSIGHGANKKTSLLRENDAVSLGSAGNDMPYDSDRKEKFKMVIGKSKKDGLDPPSKASQPQFGVSVDATAAAAILQAATRGFKNPNLEILSKTSLDGVSRGLSSEGGQASSFGSFLSSRPQGSFQNPDQNGEPSVSVPVAKAIAETAALAAASEADSSEACLTREQKVKAERLKRAKMFAAMIKSRDAPLRAEPLRGLSVERPESWVSGSGAEVANLVGKEREGSTVPLDVDTLDKIEKLDRKHSDEEYNRRRSKRRYRSRSKRHGADVDDDDNDDDDDVDEEKDHKHSKKKHRSHRSSHHSRDRHKHRRRHSSSKDRESRHRHRHDESSEDDHRHNSRSHKHSRRSHSEREVDLEEGEISTKLSDQSKVSASASDGASREASLGLSNSYQDGRAQSQPSEATEVSDDLRAKIRAMLMATL